MESIFLIISREWLWIDQRTEHWKIILKIFKEIIKNLRALYANIIRSHNPSDPHKVHKFISLKKNMTHIQGVQF